VDPVATVTNIRTLWTIYFPSGSVWNYFERTKIVWSCEVCCVGK
jgi:hypothetical protein